MDDSTLIALLGSDPERGLHELMRLYGGLVFAVVRGKLAGVCSRADIEECVSDAFAEFYASLDSFDETRGTVKALLAAIARRRAINAYHKALHENRRTAPELPEDAPDDAPSPADAAERAEEDRALLAAVTALSEPDREIIVRKFYFGESAKQIAKRLGMKPSAVDTRAHRALRKLKSLLGGEDGYR